MPRTTSAALAHSHTAPLEHDHRWRTCTVRYTSGPLPKRMSLSSGARLIHMAQRGALRTALLPHHCSHRHVACPVTAPLRTPLAPSSSEGERAQTARGIAAAITGKHLPPPCRRAQSAARPSRRSAGRPPNVGAWERERGYPHKSTHRLLDGVTCCRHNVLLLLLARKSVARRAFHRSSRRRGRRHGRIDASLISSTYHQQLIWHGSPLVESPAASHDWLPLRMTFPPPLPKAAHQLMSKLSNGLRHDDSPETLSE